MGDPPLGNGTACGRVRRPSPPSEHKAVTCLEDFEFLSIESVGTGDKKLRAQGGGTQR